MDDMTSYPEVNDLVLGTITKIVQHGVYISLDEYDGLTAYCHISEISGTWIRNIRNFVRIGEKTVARVIRVNPSKQQIDVSIRRVPQEARRRKIQEWKRLRTARNLIRIVAERMGRDPDELLKYVESKVLEEYDTLYLALEQSVTDGVEVFLELGIEEDLAKELHQIALENIVISKVTIEGVLGLRCYESDGIERIRAALLKGKEVGEKHEEATVDLYTIGSPRYKVSVEAMNYQDAEKVLAEIVDTVQSFSKKKKIEFAFEREKPQK